MIDTLIVAALVPMSLLAIYENKMVRQICIGFSLAILIICLGFSFSNAYQADLDPSLFLSSVTLFIFCLAYEYGKHRILGFLTVIGYGFLLQSLSTSNLATAFLLLLVADSVFCAQAFLSARTDTEKKEVIGDVQLALMTYVPVACSLLLDLSGDMKHYVYLASIVLRFTNWPIRSWGQAAIKKNVVSELALSAIPAFVLWKFLNLTGPYWVSLWFVLAMVIAIGNRLQATVIALSLGVMSLFPEHAFLVPAFWPLLLLEGQWTYLLVIVLAGLGVLSADLLNQVFLPEMAMALSGMAGLIFSRYMFQVNRQIKMQWFDMFLISGFLVPFIICGVTRTFPSVLLDVNATVFAGGFALGLLIFGLVKKPALITPLEPVRWTTRFIDRFGRTTTERELTTDGTALGRSVSDYPMLVRFFANIESENALMALAGTSAALLIWILC